MTIKKLIVALILCTTVAANAQVEQIARQLTEKEYSQFAEGLPGAFAAGRADIFGNSRALKKQFFLEENPDSFADFLGWNTRQFSQRSLGTVFKALSNQSKPGKNNPSPVTVKFDFPAQALEYNVTIRPDKRGTPQRSETVAHYVVTTVTDVEVEVGKGGQTSIASNRITMVWDGRIHLVDGQINNKRTISPPILRTIIIGSEIPPPPFDGEQVQSLAKDLIEEYYNNLQSPDNRFAVLAPEIPNKEKFEELLENNINIELEGNISVPVLSEPTQTIDVSTVPIVRFFVDSAPFITEDISEYSSTEAYHQLALTFTVDFEANEITRVVFRENFVPPVLAPKPEIEEETIPEPEEVVVAEPVVQPAAPRPAIAVSGRHYKVQIMAHTSYVPIANLPQRFRVENLVVEKYADNDFKYVLPANSQSEAIAIRDQMSQRGIESWVVTYEDGARLPTRATPEIVE